MYEESVASSDTEADEAPEPPKASMVSGYKDEDVLVRIATRLQESC